MKILCVCRQGQVRSVALANILNSQGHEAISLGIKSAPNHQYSEAEEYADKIIVVGDRATYNETIKRTHNKHKLNFIDVGIDRWGDPHNQELIDKIKPHLDNL